MDAISLSFYLSVLLVLRQITPYYVSNLGTTLRLRAFMATSKKFINMVGGVWWLLIGSPLAAFFVVWFFFSSPYNINLSTIVSSLQTFSGPGLPYVLLFILLWAVFALGYFGARTIYIRKGRK